jgi:hypothetical protein
MKGKTYWKIFGQLMAMVEAGQTELFKDRERILDVLLTIRRLALKHHRLAEMSCNGEGVIRGAFYSMSIGHPLPGINIAYLHPKAKGALGELTIFDVESHKAEAKIRALCAKIGFTVEFQGDPRGCTVKLAYKGRYVEIF